MSDGQKRITGMRAMPVSALVLFILVSAEQTRHLIRGPRCEGPQPREVGHLRQPDRVADVGVPRAPVVLDDLAHAPPWRGVAGPWRAVAGRSGAWQGVEGRGGAWQGRGGAWRGVAGRRAGRGGAWQGRGGAWRGVKA